MNDRHVDERKILDYRLNQRCATGAAKSRFFESGGFAREAWQVFRTALVAHAGIATLQEADTSSRYGEKHVLRCNIATPNARDPCIRTVWQKRDGDSWLVTAYPFD